MSENWTLVVGGSGGLGSACCAALAADGHAVLVGYAGGVDRAEAVAARIRDAGGRAEPRQVRLPDVDLGDLPPLRAVVFAAGADIGQPYLSEMSPDDLREAVNLELHGFVAVARAALPALRASRGSLVALVSAGQGRWPPGDGLSVIPKAGVTAAIRGLAREEGRHGVRANAVAVGVVEAGIFERIDFSEAWIDAAKRNIPLRRFAVADEIAQCVVFLASGRASYVTGQVLHADGGYAI